MTETRDFTIDHAEGEVTITPKFVGKAGLDPEATRALAHILAEHASASDRRRKTDAIRELRSQITERNDIARQLSDTLAGVAKLRDELAGAREALSAKTVECEALAARLEARNDRDPALKEKR